MLAETALPVGEVVFIRCNRHYYIGRLHAVYEREIVLRDCVTVMNTGRFGAFLANGPQDPNCEIEPFPPDTEVFIPRIEAVEVSRWPHPIPGTIHSLCRIA